MCDKCKMKASEAKSILRDRVEKIVLSHIPASADATALTDELLAWVLKETMVALDQAYNMGMLDAAQEIMERAMDAEKELEGTTPTIN